MEHRSMEGSSGVRLIILGLILALITMTTTCSYRESSSSTCLTLYKQGGAPAVFKSPKCPRWKHSGYLGRCQTAVLQGRRKSLEDRTLCALDLRIPFPAGKLGIKEVKVGVVAVFDGHNGAEASDMASKFLLEYFVLHTYFLLDSSYSSASNQGSGRVKLQTGKEVYTMDHKLDIARLKASLLQAKFYDSLHYEILKEALLRAIHDIDAKFSMEAYRKNLVSGSTASIVLLADGHFLVANIGDSKAFLCSEKLQSPAEAKAAYLRYRQERRNGAISSSPLRTYKKSFELASSSSSSSSRLVHFSVKELTRDHHPDRDDEKLRVETAGGYVEFGGVPRVNGQLAISRSIGDIFFKSFGVISTPELTDWQPLTVNDTYLVAASDGVFEKQNLQDVCDLLWEAQSYDNGRSEFSSSPCSYSLADCIVNIALQKGSTDNVAAVVVPLISTGFFENLLKERSVPERNRNCAALGPQNSTYECSAIDFNYEL